MQAEQLIEEDNMLEAFNIIELHCNRLIECAKQLDKPQYASFSTPSHLSSSCSPILALLFDTTFFPFCLRDYSVQI